jgi:spermidine synthase
MCSKSGPVGSTQQNGECVQPFELIDSVASPDGAHFQLYRRGFDYVIHVDGVELMSTRVHHSEEALAHRALERIDRKTCRVLVGGLGMGFTVAAALSTLGPDCRVVVSELIPAIVAWNLKYLGPVSGSPLEDERVSVLEGDVEQAIRDEGPWDAILLDVDNGPEALSHSSNGRLYSAVGLRTAFDSLRSEGVLSVWSAGPDHRFARRMRAAGFTLEEHAVRARRGRGAHHTVWVGQKK